MRLLWAIRLASLTGLAWLVYTPPAAAYIDPTAAGAALQSAYIMGVSMFMGLALAPRRLAGFFKGLLRRGQDPAAGPDEGAP